MEVHCGRLRPYAPLKVQAAGSDGEADDYSLISYNDSQSFYALKCPSWDARTRVKTIAVPRS